MSKIQHILVASNYRWPVYAPAFSQAIEQLKIKVSRFDFYPYISSLWGRFQLRTGYGPNLSRLNRKLYNKIDFLKPDLCLIWNGFGIFPSTVEAIRKKCWVTGYTNDDPFGLRGQRLFWRHFRRSIPEYHSHHVYRDINIPEYRALGIKHLELLRSYYVPWYHFRSPERKIQTSEKVIFIGHGEPYRAEVISALAKAGISVEIYGMKKLWKNLLPLSPNIKFNPEYLCPEEYRKKITNAGVCLAFLSRGNRDDYTRRYFEIPACDGFLVGERTATIKKLFTEDTEIVLFSTPNEAVEKCKHYLSHPAERQKIIEASINRCKDSGYDVISCASRWLKDIENFM